MTENRLYLTNYHIQKGAFPMTENNHSEVTPKKISLQEAVKKQLENKKNHSSSNKGKKKADLSTKKMKSQQTKKTSNTRRKMGV